MDKKKIVVILLLITIVLSVGSILITLNLDVGDVLGQGAQNPVSSNNANVQLIIEEQPVPGAE